MIHGTRLEWCSISVSSTSSPAASFAPHERATRLIASVALRRMTTPRVSAALTNLATRSRHASYAAVASSARVCTPRWTFALVCV